MEPTIEKTKCSDIVRRVSNLTWSDDTATTPGGSSKAGGDSSGGEAATASTSSSGGGAAEGGGGSGNESDNKDREVIIEKVTSAVKAILSRLNRYY